MFNVDNKFFFLFFFKRERSVKKIYSVGIVYLELIAYNMYVCERNNTTVNKRFAIYCLTDCPNLQSFYIFTWFLTYKLLDSVCNLS